jgi:integrase
MATTDRQLKNALRNRSPVTLSCGDGLYFRKQSETGRAAFLFRYKFAGTPRWMTLGGYTGRPGSMTLSQARVAARRARVALDQGKDPLDEKRTQALEAAPKYSFKNLAENWFTAEIVGRVRNPKVPRRYLDNYLLPALGSIKAKDIVPVDVTRILNRIRKEKPTAANDCLWYAKRVLEYGVRHRWITVNPIAGLRPSLDAGGIEKSRDRALSADEIRKLFHAMMNEPAFGGDNVLAVKLLLALCVRKGELLAAKWKEFDLEEGVWHLPKERTKTGAGLDIPLPPEVVGWLENLKGLAGSSEYVFPVRRRDPRSRQGHVGLDTLNAALSNLEHGVEHFTLHDLRRTARTHLSALGVRLEVAELCLNHRPPGVRGTNDRHQYFEERREALAQWVNLLSAIERGNKVTAIKKRACAALGRASLFRSL